MVEHRNNNQGRYAKSQSWQESNGPMFEVGRTEGSQFDTAAARAEGRIQAWQACLVDASLLAAQTSQSWQQLTMSSVAISFNYSSSQNTFLKAYCETPVVAPYVMV